MILYFDSYITDIPLPGRSRKSLKEDIRKENTAYAMPKRVDIAKYSLASYAMYPWSDVLIKYELDDPEEYKSFDKYINHLFPKAVIQHERSDSQQDYKESFKVLEKMPDKWIFYTANNDHPLVVNNPKFIPLLQKILQKADSFEKQYPYVSIIYSHYSEFMHIAEKGSPFNVVLGRDTEYLGEDELAKYYVAKNGCFHGIQIINKKLFKHWFVLPKLGDKRVIRVEDVIGLVDVKNQLMIVPKMELCAHFDKYEHSIGSPSEIQSDVLPPLFIPEGFFTNSMKIAYGYPNYRKGWVNINPAIKKYSFRDEKNGTDLKVCLDDLPLFWEKHIKKIDRNKKADMRYLHECCERYKQILDNPWSSLPFNLRTIRFLIRLAMYKMCLKIGIVENFGRFQNRHRWVYDIIRAIAV